MKKLAITIYPDGDELASPVFVDDQYYLLESDYMFQTSCNFRLQDVEDDERRVLIDVVILYNR